MEHYVDLVRAYVRHGQEEDLAAIGALRGSLIDRDVPIEELVGLHESALLALKDAVSPTSYEDVVARTSACLTELLIAYSLADHRRQDLREREQRMERERQRLEALGQMAGGVAHEINNLLQPIQGMAELGLEDAAPGSALAEHFAIIQDCAVQAATIVRGILTTVRKQSPPPQPLALAPLLTRTVHFLAAILPREVVLDLSITCGTETVLCEEAEFAQVLLNLVRNAGDAMQGSGTVRIGLASIAAPRPGAEGGNGPCLRLSVADQGCGMPQDVAARAFQPFFTTKAPGQGTGLGLSIVLSIVQGWSGTLAIDTAPGQGTRLSILLPVV